MPARAEKARIRPVKMKNIILTTLNARFIHASLGLRYLKANMGELVGQTSIHEYDINMRPIEIAESLLSQDPAIIGFGVYIWNVEESTRVLHLIKKLSPNVILVVGGPEVSYEFETQEIVRLADHLITGNADLAFHALCQQIISAGPPAEKIIHAGEIHPDDINFPYQEYTDLDIANRIIYVEASRGCPFKCEFCLSALDKTAQPFPLENFLDEMRKLYDRGVRHFKFVDRTFNLKVESSIRIMEFFLERLDEDLYLHFELIPDHLPERLKSVISQFPEHSLQFEIGIQTLNPKVQELISRKQNHEKMKRNLDWLHEHSHAHTHADLIIGLPGEDINSFAQGFNELIAMHPDEIQVGVLKRLKGTPIIRHTDEYDMLFNPYPPYNILSTRDIDFPTMQKLSRFSRYWDLIINSGRFLHSKEILLGTSPFENFFRLSDWIYQKTHQTHAIALERLFRLVYAGMAGILEREKESIRNNLLLDFERTGIRRPAEFLLSNDINEHSKGKNFRKRQQRH